MANGNTDYLAKFLTTLPSTYSAIQNNKLQRERFDYFKEEGVRDNAYKAEVVASAKEKNKLARKIFDEKLRQDKRLEEREDYKFIKSELTDYPEARKDLLLSTPFIQKNPEYAARITDSFSARTGLDDRITAAAAMSPGPRLEEYRKIRLDTNLNSVQRDYIDTGLKNAREEATVTADEYESQPSFRLLGEAETAYRSLVKEGRRTDLRNPGQFSETLEEYEGRLKQGFDRIEFFDKEVRAQEAAGRGNYISMEDFPDSIEYNNVEDTVDDKQVDDVLSVLGSPAIESAVLPPEFAPSMNLSTLPSSNSDDISKAPVKEQTKVNQAPSAYTGTDEKEKEEVDLFFNMLKNGEISRKRFMENIQKSNVNPQSIDLKMLLSAAGKPPKKELNRNQQRSIKVFASRISEVRKRNFKKQGEKTDKINKLKEKILEIDPNYKFEN